MKLTVVCLLVTFACILAAPTPKGDDPPPKPKGEAKGPLQRMFGMFTGMPKNMLKMTEKMVGAIPFMGMFPKFMEGGIDIGEGFAKGMDKMIKRN